MPFFENAGSGVAEKEDITLVQLGSTPPGLPESRTWFRCDDAFWWAASPIDVPEAYEVATAPFITDLASIPGFIWGLIPSYGRHTLPVLLHDIGCDAAGLLGSRRSWLRRQVDTRFRQTLNERAGMGIVTRFVMWAAVRLFGAPQVRTPFLLGASAALVLTALSVLRWLHDTLARCPGVACASEFLIRIEPELTQITIWFGGAAVLWLVVGTIFVSFESPGYQVVAVPAPARSFSWVALFSILGAEVVACLSLVPIVPLILVTLVTIGALYLLDLLAYAVSYLFGLIVSGVQGLAGALGIDVAPAAQPPPWEPPRFRGFFPRP